MRLFEIAAGSDDELLLRIKGGIYEQLVSNYKWIETLTNSFREPASSVYDTAEIDELVIQLTEQRNVYANPMTGADNVALEAINKLLQYFSK